MQCRYHNTNYDYDLNTVELLKMHAYEVYSSLFQAVVAIHFASFIFLHQAPSI